MRNISLVFALSLIFGVDVAVAQSLPVGDLAHDGPATPEQIALVLPVTGSLPTDATADVRYKRSSSSTWTTGHPLFRVRPQYSTNPAVGSVTNDFAWTIIDLDPGTAYDVEVTVRSGGTSVVKTANFVTRRLPPAASTPNKTIAAGSSSAQVQSTLNGLQPGDVVQFENGTYNVDGLEITRSGTANQPIYIRGESRSGVILSDSSGTILRILEASNVVIENMTLLGARSDGPLGDLQPGIYGGGFGTGSSRNTIRNLTIIGVDKGITFYDEISEALVYNNTLQGNNLWNPQFLGDNRTWDDDGINLPGFGNVAFNNTISGFGDTFSYAQHVASDTLTETRGVHYYRNEIRNSLDDLVEVDHAHRNISFYDNRSHNSSNCSSLDPLYGGPFLYARNVCINPARTNLHKWNDTNSGQFLYNNTFIATVTMAGYDPDVSAWYQPNVGAQQAYGFRNNIVVYHGDGNTLWLESGGHDVLDWTHNSWYPDREIQWGNYSGNLASIKNSLNDTTPIFSGTNRRMFEDNITSSNPWTSPVNLGNNSYTEVVGPFAPTLAAGTSPKSSGVEIPNITDGHTGGAPDRGALMDGRAIPNWGDQDEAPPPAGPVPKAPSDLIAD